MHPPQQGQCRQAQRLYLWSAQAPASMPIFDGPEHAMSIRSFVLQSPTISLKTVAWEIWRIVAQRKPKINICKLTCELIAEIRSWVGAARFRPLFLRCA